MGYPLIGSSNKKGRSNRIDFHVYPSDLIHESRIMKETKSISSLDIFDKIYICGVGGPGLEVHEQWDSKREAWRINLLLTKLPLGPVKNIVKIIEWTVRVLFMFKQYPIIVVNCHSLTSLPIGMLFKICKRSKIIYNTHELETETNGMTLFRKVFSKMQESLLIRYVDRIIVVNDSIAKWYQTKYRIQKIYVVRNFPYLLHSETLNSHSLRNKFNVPDGDILYIHHGALGKGRGIEIILKAFAQSNNNKHIIMMGYGELASLVKQYANDYKNIHFNQAVKPQEVISYISDADVGLSLFENTCLSYYYSLPNKVFEYIAGGLPVIVSDFPEMANIVDENNCGWKITPGVRTLTELIESISINDINHKKASILECKDKFVWDNEENTLLAVYNDLCDTSY